MGVGHACVVAVCSCGVARAFSVTFVAFDDGFKGIVVNVVGNPREDCQVPQATTKVHDDPAPGWLRQSVTTTLPTRLVSKITRVVLWFVDVDARINKTQTLEM